MALVGIQGELKRRELIRSYPAFDEYVNEGFCMTKFHRYLTQQIQEFLTIQTKNAFDILLLSVPPRHGKSFCVGGERISAICEDVSGQR